MTESLLLTGSTGFIGRHLKSWFEQAYAVSTFERHNGGDMTQADSVKMAMRGKTAVVHCAAVAVGRQKMSEHPEAKELDLLGLQNVAEAALNEGAFLVYPSNTLVYGHSKDHPSTENSPLKPDDAYGLLKKASEELLLSFGQRGLRYTIIRLSTVIGPDLPPHSVVRLFLRQALLGEALTLYGPGTEQRNFIDINDVCLALSLMLQKQPLSQGQIFNVCHTDSLSLNNLAQLIIELTESSSPIVHTSHFLPPDQIISPHKIGTVLGWHPTISARESLVRIIQK